MPNYEIQGEKRETVAVCSGALKYIAIFFKAKTAEFRHNLLREKQLSAYVELDFFIPARIFMESHLIRRSLFTLGQLERKFIALCCECMATKSVSGGTFYIHSCAQWLIAVSF